MIIALTIQSIIPSLVSAYDVAPSDMDKLQGELNITLGEDEAKQFINEIKEKALDLADVTKDEVLDAITSLASEYGVVFTDEQLETLYNYINEQIEEGKTEASSNLWESFMELLKNFWAWVKDLKKDSKLEISPNDGNEKDLVETNDDMVTINIPTVNDIDNTMDNIIAKIRAYVFPNQETNTSENVETN